MDRAYSYFNHFFNFGFQSSLFLNSPPYYLRISSPLCGLTMISFPMNTPPMKPSKIIADDVIFLGLKSKVAALSKRDGSILWSTGLPGGMGGNFVTVNSDGKCVYAYTNGKIHCLDISSGRI